MEFKKAVKQESKLRLALIGPSGSGKTYTSLAIASHLGERVAVVDTEHGSASKYADLFGFDTLELASFHPQQYIGAIEAAERGGYDVLIIDSLSHAWAGKGGVLELKDQEASKRGVNSYTAWAKMTPLQNRLVDTIIAADLHIITTMRAKTKREMVEKDGRTQVKTLGLAAVQREGVEYEFDVVAYLDLDNNLAVEKTRCPDLYGKVIPRAGKEVADMLLTWLAGAPATPRSKPSETPEIICHMCGNPITDYTGSDGKAYTVSALVDISADAGLASTCGPCLKKHKQERKGGAA